MSLRSDDGFSLVEVILAMLLLSVLSLAVLPLIIGATALSVQNKSSVQATALADSHLAALRSQFPAQPTIDTKCADLQTAASKLVDNDPATLPDIVVPSGFTRSVVVGACPTGALAGKPAAILVTITVTPQGEDPVVLRSRIPVTVG